MRFTRRRSQRQFRHFNSRSSTPFSDRCDAIMKFTYSIEFAVRHVFAYVEILLSLVTLGTQGNPSLLPPVEWESEERGKRGARHTRCKILSILSNKSMKYTMKLSSGAFFRVNADRFSIDFDCALRIRRFIVACELLQLIKDDFRCAGRLFRIQMKGSKRERTRLI